MGRMSRYLCQTAQYESVVLLEDGSTKLDDYGKPFYEQPVTIKCRHEPSKVNYASSLGQFVNYTSTYYVDETVKVKVQDKLDGQIVLQVYEYRDGAGSLVGYEVHV